MCCVLCVGECVSMLACLFDCVVGNDSDLFSGFFIFSITFPMPILWLGEIGAVGNIVVYCLCDRFLSSRFLCVRWVGV